ncbi:APC family permease [Cellulomonas chengniuliangii]|uniref:APC family permease n=1 Tax=Cellulomonas chengniuliangii TaxID=2968084 RepID=UPI001D0EE5EC|nr:APC family permease [Cellulomonas chengniuliangii]MCC2317343.1 APC family permease [Cellulomonas chengniuliangii]
MPDSEVTGAVHPVTARSRARPRRRERPGRARGTSLLALLSVVGVVTLGAAPTMAAYGLGAVPLVLVPATLFLVPAALVVAELGSTWHGGVHAWVREGLGPRWGLAAGWLQWVQGVVRMPALLASAAASLALAVLDPGLASSDVYTGLMVVGLFWAVTLAVSRGRALVGRWAAWAGLLGVVVPVVLLTGLGLGWLATGERSAVSFEAAQLVPPLTGASSIVLVITGVLAFTGLEVGATQVGGTQPGGTQPGSAGEPARWLPRAVATAAIAVVAVLVLSSLAISVAVEKGDPGLTSVNLALGRYLEHFGVAAAVPVVSALLAIGAIGSVLVWAAGPSTALATAGREGLLPGPLQRSGRGGSPRVILLLQGVVVTTLAAFFALAPDTSAAIALVLATAFALYLLMYMMVFAAAVALRRTRPDVVRGFRAPALPLVAGIGFLTSLAAFLAAFIPPTGTQVDIDAYAWTTAALVVAVGAPPFVLYALRRSSWDRRTPAERARDARLALVRTSL